MKNNRILRVVLGFLLVFGLAAAMTGCDMKAEIIVTNASQYPVDDVVTARVYMPGRGDTLASQSVPRGQSVTFSLDSGDYLIKITSGSGSVASYPQNGSATSMSGTLRLRYNGVTIEGSRSWW